MLRANIRDGAKAINNYDNLYREPLNMERADHLSIPPFPAIYGIFTFVGPEKRDQVLVIGTGHRYGSLVRVIGTRDCVAYRGSHTHMLCCSLSYYSQIGF